MKKVNFHRILLKNMAAHQFFFYYQDIVDQIEKSFDLIYVVAFTLSISRNMPKIGIFFFQLD